VDIKSERCRISTYFLIEFNENTPVQVQNFIMEGKSDKMIIGVHIIRKLEIMRIVYSACYCGLELMNAGKVFIT